VDEIVSVRLPVRASCPEMLRVVVQMGQIANEIFERKKRKKKRFFFLDFDIVCKEKK
jgi:hypothetical protein